MNSITTSLKLKHGLILLLLLVLSGFAGVRTAMLIAAPPPTELSEPSPAQSGPQQAVTGEVVMIEGHVQFLDGPFSKRKRVQMVMEHLYVTEMGGDEAIQFHVTEKTQLDRDLRVGDRVDVLAHENGEALSVKKKP